MSPPALEASVIICAYTERRWPDVVAAIASVRAQTVKPAEILLVCDHNPALQRRATEEFVDVRVLASTGRRGLSGARNTALGVAKGDVLVFLDDDAVAAPDWLANLLDGYRDPTVLAVGGSASPLWPDGGARPSLLPAGNPGGHGELDWVVGCTYTGQPKQDAPVRNLMGCNMSFRREAFSLAGPFAEHLGRVGRTPLGCEETEVCIRLRGAVRNRVAEGHPVILFRPSARIWHRVSEERLTWSYLRRRGWAEGVSKAAVSDAVGTGEALSTERDYVRTVLTRAALRELGRSLRGRRAGVTGLTALVTVLAATAAGYLRGRIATRGRPLRPASELVHGPVHVATVDLAVDRPSQLTVPRRPVGAYQTAQVLVRDGHRTVDVLLLPVRDGVVRLDGILPEPAEHRVPMPRKENPPRPRISVVVVALRHPERALRAVCRAFDAGYPELEVLVADTLPDQGTLRIESEKLGARYLACPGARLSDARNRAAATGRGELITFLDEDVEVEPGWFDVMAEELADPSVGCVTGLLLPESMETDTEVLFDRMKGYSHTVSRQRIGPDTAHADPLYPLAMQRYGPGSCMTWRRTEFTRLGGFSPLLGPGTPAESGEDLDLFVRLARSGGTVVHTPHAVARHAPRPDWLELREVMRGYGVGLTAMLTLSVLRNPAQLGAIIRRTRRGVAQLAARIPEVPDSEGAAKSRLAQLRRDERYGMLIGPLVLAKSWRARRTAR